MATIQKHTIHVKHVFKQYNILNDTYSLYNCEIFARNFAKRRCKTPGLGMMKIVMGSDVVTETRISEVENN